MEHKQTSVHDKLRRMMFTERGHRQAEDIQNRGGDNVWPLRPQCISLNSPWKTVTVTTADSRADDAPVYAGT